MKGPVERIKKLIPYLPAKDISLGYKFIEKRDFESLKSLVDSAIYKIKIANKGNMTEEISNNLEGLDKLKLETDEYNSIINYNDDNEELYNSDYLDLY